jgi:DNA-directed RNA polymerase beta' subunit
MKTNSNQVFHTENEPHPYLGGTRSLKVPVKIEKADFEVHDQPVGNDLREGRIFNIKIDFLKHADFSDDPSVRSPLANYFKVKVVSPETQNLTGTRIVGTLYDSRMGVPPESVAADNDRKCTTCETNDCTGHFGKILFPDKIFNPYQIIINEVIDILGCLCVDCADLLIPISVLKEKGIEAYPKHLRIKKILEWSSGKSVTCKSGRKCPKFDYQKRESFAEGVISGSGKIKRTAREIDFLFKNLPVEVINILGFDDVTEFDKYTLVGIPVPPISLRLPNRTANGTMVHEFTEALVKIIKASNAWGESLKNDEIRKDLKAYGINPEAIPTLDGLRKEITDVTVSIANRESAIRNKARENKKKVPEYEARISELKKTGNPKDKVKAKTLEIELSRMSTGSDEAQLRGLHDKLETLKRQLIFLEENASKLGVGKTTVTLPVMGGSMMAMKTLYAAVAEHFKKLGALFQSKEGIIRSGVVAKRSDFTARAVITPNPYSRLDTLDIPEYIAKEAGISAVVVESNIRKYTVMLNQGKITFIESVNRYGKIERTAVTKSSISRGYCRLKIGDRITRWLMDGDKVVAGREPSLHPGNMMAFYARITPNFVIGVPFGIVTPWAGDFDGDESYLSVPQTEAAQAEVEEIMLSTKNIIGIRLGTPIIGVIYNALKNWHVATSSNKIFEDDLVQSALADALSYVDDDDYVGSEDVFGLTSLKERCARHGVYYATGRGLFSWLLPSDLVYPPGAASGKKSPSGIRVVDGVLVEGVIRKQDIGVDSAGSIVHYLHVYYGYKITASFIHKAFRLGDYIGKFFPLTLTPLDCSLKHCEVPTEKFEETLKQSMKDMERLGAEPSNPYERAVFEQSLTNIDQGLKEEAGKLYDELASKNYLTNEEYERIKFLSSKSRTEQEEREFDRLRKKARRIDDGALNQYYLGIAAGTKGSRGEFVEMTGALGQLIGEEGRLEKDTSCNTRCLTSYRRDDFDPRSRGFVESNYHKGLRPQEKFHSHTVQRISGTDAALKTPEAGSIERELSTSIAKYMTENGCLVSQSMYLLQYIVGEDGFDPVKSYSHSGKAVAYDPVALADIVNQRLGWRNIDGAWYHEVRHEGETYYVKY